jgi:hypothetical protein
MAPKGRATFLRALFYQSARISPPDQRPVSGMIGQKNLAYLTDPWGKTLRFVPGERTPEDVGPATYNPQKPDIFTKDLKISPNSRRFEFMRPSYSVGPGDHPTLPPSSRIIPRIGDRPPATNVIPFVSGDLAHPDWCPPLRELSRTKRRFPSVNFTQQQCTSQFTSRSSRNLFNPTPNDHF